MIEHLKYLKNKGLYDIEFHKESVKSIRFMYTGEAIGQTAHFTQQNEDDESIVQDINISLFKDSSKKIMYHGTTLENAKKIITDGVIKKAQNVGLTNRSTDKDTIEYNKVFITDMRFASRHYGLRRCNNYDDVMIEIDITKYQVYTFIADLEWIIWGEVNIDDVKFYYFKDNVPMGELTPKEIMNLSITEECQNENVFLEALCKNDIYLFKDPFGEHGVYHSQKIILILQKLDFFELLPFSQKTILAWTGLYHDIGMKDNKEDTLHGLKSYRMIFNTGLIDNVKGLNAEELEIMRFIIMCHCMDDEGASKALGSWPDIKNIETAKLLYDMFKDAEDLNAIGLNDFDIKDLKRLRRPYSFAAIEYMRELYMTNDIMKLV